STSRPAESSASTRPCSKTTKSGNWSRPAPEASPGGAPSARADSSHRRARRSRRAQIKLPRDRRPPRERPAGTPGVIAVVKANAYGHGAVQIARALEDAGADLLACADIEEGAVLRAAGVRAEILVFGALSVSDLDGLFDGRLT